MPPHARASRAISRNAEISGASLQSAPMQRLCAVTLFLLVAGPAFAQGGDPANGKPVLPEKPGGLDMTLLGDVKVRVEEVRQETAALERSDPSATKRISTLHRQIEILERHAALLEESAKKAEPLEEGLAAGQRALQEAEAALRDPQLDRIARDLARHRTIDALQHAFAMEFTQPQEEARRRQEEADRALQALLAEQARRGQEVGEAQARLLDAQARLKEATATLETAKDLPDAEYTLLRRRVDVNQQGIVHATMRQRFLEERAPRLEKEIELATLRRRVATQQLELARLRGDAARVEVERRLALESRKAESAIRRKQAELEAATSPHLRLRLAEELENEQTRADESALRQKLAELTRRRDELRGLREEADRRKREIESAYAGGRGAPAKPSGMAVRSLLRELEGRTARAAFRREVEDYVARSASNEEARLALVGAIDRLDATLLAREREAEAAMREAGGGAEAWRAEQALWADARADRQRLLAQKRDAFDHLLATLDERARERRELQAAERETLFLLRRENLFLRGESHLTWAAVLEGLRDLARLPGFLLRAGRDALAFLASPPRRGTVLALGGGFLLLGLLLLVAGRALRRRLLRARAAADPATGHARALLLRLLRGFLLALLLFLLPYSASAFLPDLPDGVATLLASMAWVFGAFWFARSLNRSLLHAAAQGTGPLKIAHDPARRFAAGLDLLLCLSLLFVPFQSALTNLGYANHGAIEAVGLVYKVLVGLVVIALLLRKQTLLGMLPAGASAFARFLRLLVLLLQPVAVLLVPVVLLLDALRYDILAGLIAGIATLAVGVVVAGFLLYRAAVAGTDAGLRRLHRAAAPAPGPAPLKLEASLQLARFALKLFFLLASVWAAMAIGGTDLSEVRRFFAVDLPFQSPTAERRVTLWNLFVAAFLLWFFLAATKHLKLALQHLFLARTKMDDGLQYTIRTLFGYALVATGVYLAFKEVFDLGNLGYILAALSVGVGFGLQEIVSNFISGLIVLFERPLKVGDLVSVGDTEGVVQRINIRATTIQTRDDVHILVPNCNFITKIVVNFVYKDPKLRVHLPVGVSYGSDVG